MINRKVLGSVATMLLATTTVSFAQSESSGTTGGQGMQSGQGSASDVTCAQITAMDTATVPGILYFISGYSQGQRDSGSGMGGSAMSSTTGGSTTDSGAASAGTSGSTTGTSGSTDTSGSATGDSDASNGTDTDATTGAGSNAMSSGSGTDTSGAGSTGTSGSAQVGTIKGYFEIPVEQLIVACGSSPDRSVSEMLDEEGQRQGATSSSGSMTNGDAMSGTSDTSGDDSTSTDAGTSGTTSQ